MLHQQIESDAEQHVDIPTAADILDLLMAALADGLDHPDLWPMFPSFVEHLPELSSLIEMWRATEWRSQAQVNLQVVAAMTLAATGRVAEALEMLEPLGVANSQSPLVQGAIFYLHGLLDPSNPKYQLKGMICTEPFERLDVLDRSTHQCCASWLQTSAGDMSRSDWQDVWNSGAAQDVRASILDGSYRHCNKVACPKIHSGYLIPADEIAKRSDEWRDIIEDRRTEMPAGPKIVNLAYDRTCNLSCPSCRSEKFAADRELRARFDGMQERNIIPMLKTAEIVFITGSGDPFASKNFRQLMDVLGPEDFPQLRFQVMTNGMLLTRREWERFPALHGRVSQLRISIDAATGPTHELLRRGARWDVMLENLAFAGELRQQELVHDYQLVFVVQAENFREMGAACDLSRQLGADRIFFSRMTNWGTFTESQYAEKAVFLASHPDHAEFLSAMQDPRLLSTRVDLGDLATFVSRDHPELRRNS
jgi:organic radical activating enzyme